MADQFEIDRLAKIEARIVAYEDALLALSQEGVESYTLDTNQSRQTVTKRDVSKLEATLESLLNQRAMLKQRLYGGGSIIVTPGF